MSTTTVPTASQAKCAQCEAPTQFKCSGCSSQLGEETQIFTYYCKKECQVAHRKNHKALCKAHETRKLLYHAGETLQGIFYVYRELMFDKKIAKVENKDGKLYMHEGFYPKMKTSMDVLYDFPLNLVQNPKDKYAMLAYLSCDDAVAWMQEMTEIFLKGVAKDIEEIVISPKNTKREVMLVGINGEINDDQSQFLHIVFKITLQNGGGVYSLDFSSAQFGYYSPVTPWSEYTDNRVSKVISSHCSGFAKHGWLSKIGQTTLEGYLAHIYRGCPDAMKNGMRNWESEYIPISAFLNLPQKQFEKAQRELCGMIELHIFSYRELMREQAKKALKNPSGLTKV